MNGSGALLPLVVVGLTTGSVYAIAAMGLVITFKTSGVFNFAHGALAAVGAYLMHSLRTMGLPWPISLLLAVAVVGVLGGVLLERMARLLARRPPASRIVATIGLLLGIQGLLVVVYGAPTIVFDRFLPEQGVGILGVNVRMSQLIVVALAFMAAASLYAFFQRARLGVATQAVVDDPQLLGLQGTNPHAVRRYAWIIGASFAAVSGILLAHELNLDAAILTLLVVQAFGAAALGAFSSLPGTYLGGLAIGVGAAVLPDYLGPLSGLAGQSTLPFIVLFVALIVTPRHRLVEIGSRVIQRVAEPRPLPRQRQLVVGVLAAAALLGLPHVVGVQIGLYTQALASVILFASLFLLVRTSGQVSLCHMAFAGIGAAVAARLAMSGVPWLAAVVLGGLAAVPAGAVVAIPSIRMSGIYLAVATFGYGLLVERLLFGSDLLFGSGAGAVSAPRPALLGLPTDTDVGYYYVVLALAVGSLGLVTVVQRTRLGRLLRGLADSPVALQAHGTNTNLTRLYVFMLSAFLAGIGGAAIGPVTGTASRQTFEFIGSLLLLAILAIAGRRLLVAPFVAAFLFSVAGNVIDDPTLVGLLPVAFGAAAVAAAMAGSMNTGRRREVAMRARRHARRAAPSRWAARQPVPVPTEV